MSCFKPRVTLIELTLHYVYIRQKHVDPLTTKHRKCQLINSTLTRHIT